MRRKKKWGLAAALATISSLFIFAGCTVGESLEEIVEENDLVAQVTYYANGGDFGVTVSDTTDRENVLLSQKKELYYKDGSKIADIGNIMLSNGSIDFERRDYDFAGWYHVETDVDGNIVYEVNEVDGVKYMKLGDKVDFSKTIEDGEHWYLCAAWTPRVKVKMKLVCDTLTDGETIKGKFGEKDAELKNGDIVHEFSFASTGKVDQVSDSWTPDFEAENGTYVAYYADEACTQEVQWPISNTANTDVFIYAKYLEGVWTVLRTKNDVKTLFSSKAENSETKFYLSNSIDAENVTVYPRAKFAATLEGNGYTISNLTLQSTLSQTSVSALFGNIQETATIKDITFADLTVTYNSRPNMGIGDEYQNQHNEKWTHGYEAYLVYATRAMGSVVENVVINGNMTVSIGDYTCVHNLWDETTQSFVEQNWMFGDGDSTGFTVNATLEIKARWWNGNN
jgi:hypothetical protein